MRDRYLVGVVSTLALFGLPSRGAYSNSMQCNLKPANMRGVKSFAMVLCVCLSPTTSNTHSQHSIQATSKEGKDGGIELVKPPENSKIGDKVYFEGPDYDSEKTFPFSIIFGFLMPPFSPDATPLSQLNPKKKIFETIQPGFTTLDTHEAAWINPVTKSVHRIRTKDGVCIAPTFVGASLS